MAAIAGLGTTYNLPNYGGEILTVTPSETPFLSAIGGLNQQGESTDSPEFEWQTEALGDPEQPEHLEGADAPGPEEESRANVSNLVQIFQYSISVSYTKQASTGAKSGVNNGQENPIKNELAHQTQIKLKVAARDINFSLLRGSYQKPANNTTARKTRGLLSAISTNVSDLAGAALTKVAVLDLVQQVWDRYGVDSEGNPTLICNATVKRGLTKLFITDAGYQEKTRNVGGVNLTMIETDLGILNIMLERSMPTTQLAFAHLGMCRPRYLIIPESGFLFVEPLAKTGASYKYQLYGECGLEYGAETAHAKMLNVGAVPGA